MYPESEVTDALPDHASLLSLNEEMLERDLESHPWVQGIGVNEDWNSGIVTVQVEERRPVLDAEVEGRKFVLSADGEELPGPGGAGLRRVKLDRDQVGEILVFASRLHGSGLTLESVDRADAGGIEATVEGREVIFSGNVGKRRVTALKSIMPEHPDARVFDLRSPQRVVVGAPQETRSGPKG
jgi:hypothetical protein